MTQHVDAIYAWIVNDPEGNEAILLVINATDETAKEQGPVQLMTQFRDEAETMRVVAVACGEALGHRVRLVRFGHRETLEEHQTAAARH